MTFDYFLLHRDDPSRPVGEVLKSLTAVHDGGFTLRTGVSNWSLGRVSAALDASYPVDAVSNYFGLGVPAGPPPLFERVRAAYQAAYVDNEGRVHGNTQTAYVVTLGFGLVGPDRREAVAHHLLRAIDAAENALTTGFIGVSLLLPVLSDLGHDDLAFRLLERKEFPFWLYPLRHGATTIWERWDGYTAENGFQSAKMNSFNHYALGSVGEWLYRYLAGIDQSTVTDTPLLYSKPGPLF